MSNEMEIRKSLYQRMESEYNAFIDGLKKKNPEEILEFAYEKVVKEETLGMFYPESENFRLEHIEALSKTEVPLEELYQGWMDSDVNLNQLYEDNVYDTMEELFDKQQVESKKNTKSLER